VYLSQFSSERKKYFEQKLQRKKRIRILRSLHIVHFIFSVSIMGFEIIKQGNIRVDLHFRIQHIQQPTTAFGTQIAASTQNILFQIRFALTTLLWRRNQLLLSISLLVANYKATTCKHCVKTGLLVCVSFSLRYLRHSFI
jgi:hypothetical protein